MPVAMNLEPAGHVVPRMRRGWIVVALALGACAERRVDAPGPSPGERLANAPCDVQTARSWIERWFGAWELASRAILRLPGAPPPEIVFFDAACVYTTASVTAAAAPPVAGPLLAGAELPWRALPHDGSFVLPDGSAVPVQLMTFTSASPGGGPFFVMAAPSYWAAQEKGDEPELTAIFLHEFAHTRQIGGMGDRLGPIDASWSGEEELNDDAVQHRFEGDPEYVAAYVEERDLLYRAAGAATTGEARALAARALERMRRRHARWFLGEDAVYAELDQIFLALEGVGQWTAFAWLADPRGGGLDRATAITTMLGRRKWWVQDEGLALLLAVDRLLPGWAALEFGNPAPGALDLLALAVEGPPHA